MNIDLIKLILPLIVPAFVFLIGAITIYNMDTTHSNRVLSMFTKNNEEDYKGPNVQWNPKEMFNSLLFATVIMLVLTAGYSLINKAIEKRSHDKDAMIERYEEYIRQDEARQTLQDLKIKIDEHSKTN